MNNIHFDAVVVGSGFGGSVMAYRLAEAGRQVCLLERGKIYPPGSFPRSPYRMKTNFWDPSEGLYGMYNFWSFQGLGAVISSGLGGGSLIYANILIRKPEKWFVKEDIFNGGYEYWPVNRADLDPHYDRVEKMLNAQTYPFDQSPYDKTPKTIAFRKIAEEIGLNPFFPKQAVTFANPGEAAIPGEPIHENHKNMHGRTRYTCRLCGECDIGCNYGSKNTLDYNYLSEAKRLGAEIKPLCEVRSFEPREGGGYIIHYVEHDLKQEGQRIDSHDSSVLPLRTITADYLVLSAGTIGTTFLLLKNRAAFPKISNQLGSRFSGNGDILGLAVKCSDSSTGSRIPRIIDPGYGPAITSAVLIPDELDNGSPAHASGQSGRGFYIEDAGYPEHWNWIMQVFDTPRAAWGWRAVARRLLRQYFGMDRETDLGAEIAGLFGASELSAGLLPLLGMGRDIPDGRLMLRGKKLDCDWRKFQSGAYFNRVRDTMQKMAKALGGTYKDNYTRYLSRLITVHPLGGCPMGRNEQEGVVNAYGEVFNYPGLYVADGSVMPGPVGPNPSLTIAALADRFADRLLERLSGEPMNG